MTEQQVTSALGPPDDRMTTSELLRDQLGGATVIVSGPLPEQDFWIYFDAPRGYDTEIILENGHVVSVNERRRT